MKRLALLSTLVFVTLFFAGCAPSQEIEDAQKLELSGTPTPSAVATASASPMTSDTTSKGKTMNAQATHATIRTVKGEIEIELYPQDAPKTVENFATLSNQGFYNNLTFHRVVPGFVIQGGDPNGNGTGGKSIYGDKFEDELNPQTQSYKNGYKQGVVAMANSGPNTNGSQFFIMLEDNDLPPLYSIFGKVTKGMDVVKNIAIGDKILSISSK